MLKTVRVPPPFEAPFERAEQFVGKLFSTIEHRPEQGTLRVGGERYVFMNADSLYLAWFQALSQAFGDEAASEFIYNTAREIGRNDSARFSKALSLTDGIDRLSSGPVHFAFAGWALVDILGDSAPSPDDNYFLHYYHPNTFEAEVVVRRGEGNDRCRCLFSAGYSAGWCSDAFGVEVHGREIRCVARGDAKCEFVMAPASRLDEHARRLGPSSP